MFTGIITDVGDIVSIEQRVAGQLHRIRVRCRYDLTGIADGASIAHNGVCMTVVDKKVADGASEFAVDAAAETMNMTTARHWPASLAMRRCICATTAGGMSPTTVANWRICCSN